MTAKRIRRISRIQEQKLAKIVGGRVQPGSGAVPGYKGDVRLRGRFRIEAKFTTKKSYTLKLQDLLKIQSECNSSERPVFVVEFKEEESLRSVCSWVIIPQRDWEKLIAKTTEDQ